MDHLRFYQGPQKREKAEVQRLEELTVHKIIHRRKTRNCVEVLEKIGRGERI
jgi:hypothetical protein